MHNGFDSAIRLDITVEFIFHSAELTRTLRCWRPFFLSTAYENLPKI